jgi:hypothetical protein
MDLDELDEESASEDVDLAPENRRLLTQSYDLNVSTLLDQWADRTLILPDIQRQYVWDNARASRLVESLLLNIPIPVVYFAETEDVKYLVIDGHQRIRSIARYVNGEFALSGLRVLSTLNGRRFYQLTEREQRQIKTRVLRAIIISFDSDPAMKFEVFERLNTGSIALNAQEVRNSTHRGPMNDLIGQMVKDPALRGCVGTAEPRRRMADQELVLRHLAMRSNWREYRPPMKRFLNDYMVMGNQLGEQELASVAECFAETAADLHSVFDGSAFRINPVSKVPGDRALNRALAEVQLTAFSWVRDRQRIHAVRSRVLSELTALHERRDFVDSVKQATGDRRRLLTRLRLYCETLEQAGLELEVQVPQEAE